MGHPGLYFGTFWCLLGVPGCPGRLFSSIMFLAIPWQAFNPMVRIMVCILALILERRGQQLHSFSVSFACLFARLFSRIFLAVPGQAFNGFGIAFGTISVTIS